MHRVLLIYDSYLSDYYDIAIVVLPSLYYCNSILIEVLSKIQNGRASAVV